MSISVGERIKHFRNLKKWSQMTLANEAGINTAFLGQLERDEKNPTVQTLEKITSALGITLEDFFKTESYVSDEVSVAIEQINLAMKSLSGDDAVKLSGLITQMISLIRKK